MDVVFQNCKKNTMVSVSHLQYLSILVEEMNTNRIGGAIVECGVWKGGCMMWMIRCQSYSDKEREFYLYDTFDGMTFPGSSKDAEEAQRIYKNIESSSYKRDYDKWHDTNKWAYAPIDLVKKNIEMIDYDASKIHYVKGDVLETLETNEKPPCISILRLDTDWYESTKKELEVLYPLVSPGGYIIVDDYYAWKGSRVATDEFLANHMDEVYVIPANETVGVFVMKKKLVYPRRTV